jgi:hypothetical protein
VSFIYKIIKGGPYDLLLKINGYDRNELGDKVSVISKLATLSENISLTFHNPTTRANPKGAANGMPKVSIT